MGRCFLTRSDVNPGQEEKLPALMAASKVEGTGLKQDAWRNDTSSCFVCVANALFATWSVECV